jgi:hypothetical protein
MEFVRSRVYRKSDGESMHITQIYFNDKLLACKNAVCSCSFAAIKFIFSVFKRPCGMDTHKNLPIRNGKEALALFKGTVL